MGRYGIHTTGPMRPLQHPELELIGAILKQAVIDAMSRPRNAETHEGKARPSHVDIQQAQAFLRGELPGLEDLVELLGADVDKVRPALLKQAKLL